MTQELLYTSAPQGLNPGSRGFCTVVRTRSMPPPLETVLESLSGYRPAFPLNDPRASQNPVNYSHVRAAAGGKTLSVLSRVADYGFDYSQRTNKIAHHVVLASDERPEAGPAWLLAQPGFMDARWDGQPRTLPAGRRVPSGTERAARCATWAALTGDAGWAGVLAESWLSGTPTYVIFEPGTDTLSLIREAVALLPPRKRWEATFATYFTGMPSGVVCGCRCVVEGSQEAIQGSRLPNVVTIAVNRRLARAQGGSLVEAARTGVVETSPQSSSGSRTPSGSHFAPSSASNSVSMNRPASESHSRPQHDSSAINAPTARRAQGEPPPVRVSQLPPGVRRGSRAWIWWLSGSLTAVLLLVAGVFLALRPTAPKENREMAAAEKPAAPAHPNPALPAQASKKEPEEGSANPQNAAGNPSNVTATQESAQAHNGAGRKPTADKDSPATSVPDTGKRPAASKPAKAPNDDPQKQQEARSGGETTTADKSKPSAAHAKGPIKSTKPSSATPRPSWPAFLASNPIESTAEGPVDIGQRVANKHYLLAAWLPDGTPWSPLDQPAEKIVIGLKAWPNITTTLSTTEDGSSLKLKVVGQKPDLGAARYCLLEMIAPDQSKEPHFFQLFEPRHKPMSPHGSATVEGKHILAEWPLPARLERKLLPPIRADFVTLSDGTTEIRFEWMRSKGRGLLPSLVPNQNDYDFFADLKEERPKEVPKLYLRYVGGSDDGPSDVVAVAAYSFKESLQSGNTRLLEQARQVLGTQPADTESMRKSLAKHKEKLEEELAKQKGDVTHSSPYLELQEVRELEQRLQRWIEIRKIFNCAKPQVTGAKIVYDTSRDKHTRQVTLVELEKEQLEAHK